MGAVDTTYTFTATDTITSSKMNNIIDQTTITGDAIFENTLEVVSGKLKVRAQGIRSNELATDAVTETKITNGSVTPTKLSIGKVTWGSDYTDIGYGVSGTYYASLTPSRSGDGNTTLSFGSQTGVNNGASITRESGANGNLVISNTGTGSIKFNDVPLGSVSGVAPIFGARAWVNFNGTGTPAIRGSGNVSSITDNGTGDYTLNFTSALVDANYSFSGSASRLNATTSMSYLGPSATTTYTTSALQVLTANDSGALEDALRCSVIVHR